jgi:hypothetical protein
MDNEDILYLIQSLKKTIYKGSITEGINQDEYKRLMKRKMLWTPYENTMPNIYNEDRLGILWLGYDFDLYEPEQVTHKYHTTDYFIYIYKNGTFKIFDLPMPLSWKSYEDFLTILLKQELFFANSQNRQMSRVNLFKSELLEHFYNTSTVEMCSRA